MLHLYSFAGLMIPTWFRFTCPFLPSSFECFWAHVTDKIWISSCLLSWWRFSLYFRPVVYSHFKHFRSFPLCIPFVWWNIELVENAVNSQDWQCKISRLCILLMWFCRTWRCLVLYSQRSQRKFEELALLCIFKCCASLSAILVLKLHKVHSIGLSRFPWRALMCKFRLWLVVSLCPHCEHGYALIIKWSVLMCLFKLDLSQDCNSHWGQGNFFPLCLDSTRVRRVCFAVAS